MPSCEVVYRTRLMPNPSKRLIVVCPILPNPITPTVACAGEDSLSYAAAWGVGNAKARPEEAERADARFAARFRTAAAGSTASRATCPPRLLGCPVGRRKREQIVSFLVECVSERPTYFSCSPSRHQGEHRTDVGGGIRQGVRSCTYGDRGLSVTLSYLRKGRQDR